MRTPVGVFSAKQTLVKEIGINARVLTRRLSDVSEKGVLFQRRENAPKRELRLEALEWLREKDLNQRPSGYECIFDILALFINLQIVRFYAAFSQFTIDNLRWFLVVYGGHKQQINNK